jgi:quinoprotein glucose dehydrogenase
MTIFMLWALVQDEPEFAARKLQAPPGFKVVLFAAEPDVVNPIGLDVDDRGRVWLAETRRYNTSALYVKQHGHWYFDDLACRTLDDRIGVARKFLGPQATRLEVDSEVVRVVEDLDGDGVADTSRIFADGFRSLLDGCASGVLVRGNDVWLANVPSLWRLADPGKTGKATERRELSRGYGVRFGNSGHDLHGLVFGPDGRLYFSMGDRGLHVSDAVSAPDQGAVLRCDPDGTNLELYATGLRNPQGLVFDADGNLWTCDNNADMGDPARWIHVVEGGDYGWRVGYQYATDPWGAQTLKPGHALVIPRDTPWTVEEVWKGAAPYALPPAGTVSNGPCGIAYDPGTGFPAPYRGRFYLCDFPGGVHSLSVAPRGASYALETSERFLWGGWPTDCRFGPDGALYVADWVYGFPMTGKGRVFRVVPDNADAVGVEVRRLLAEGLGDRDPLPYLGHADLRVRFLAQRALRSFETATASANPRVRLHAVWGLRERGDVKGLLPLLKDPDATVRGRAAQMLGDLRAAEAFDAVLPLVKDAQPQVRMRAMIAAGKIGGAKARGAALEFLKTTGGDPFLRHAGVFALAAGGDPGPQPDADRLGLILALRRLASPRLAEFLKDPDPDLAFEAGRAIHDVPVTAALGALADLLQGPCPERLRLRAMSAAFRRGTAADAEALARIGDAEALKALAAWATPASRNRLTGLWQPLDARDAGPAREAVRKAWPGLKVSSESIRAAAALGLKETAPGIEAEARDARRAPALRIDALQALLRLGAGAGALAAALEDPDAVLQREAVRLSSALEAGLAVPKLESLAGSASIPVRQAAIRALGARGILRGFAERLKAGTLEPALRLDVREAAGLPAEEGWADVVEGGDAEMGRRIFFDRSTVACLRCHRVNGTGGGVGPDLSKVGAERTREQLVESIVDPNKVIVQGFGQELVKTTADTIEAGRVKSETAEELVLIGADGRDRVIPKSRIAGRKPGLSAMPADLIKSLTKRDLRDVVEYLSGLGKAIGERR